MVVDQMSNQFFSLLKILFDILDDNCTGSVRFQEIENHWQNDSVQDGNCRVLESLKRVTPVSGFLTFETFIAGIILALDKYNNKEMKCHSAIKINEDCAAVISSTNSCVQHKNANLIFLSSSSNMLFCSSSSPFIFHSTIPSYVESGKKSICPISFESDMPYAGMLRFGSVQDEVSKIQAYKHASTNFAKYKHSNSNTCYSQFNKFSTNLSCSANLCARNLGQPTLCHDGFRISPESDSLIRQCSFRDCLPSCGENVSQENKNIQFTYVQSQNDPVEFIDNELQFNNEEIAGIYAYLQYLIY